MHNTVVLAEPDTGPLFVTAEDGQVEEWLRRAKDADKRRVQRQVAEVAGHLAEVNPDAPITECARFSTAVTVTGSVAGVRPLLRQLPFADDMPKGTTRREYADLVRASAGDGELPPSPIHVPRITPRPDNRAAVAA